jgi:hypothetical protein
MPARYGWKSYPECFLASGNVPFWIWETVYGRKKTTQF